MRSLKNLNELNVFELPLSRKAELDYLVGISENELEDYLIANNYNVYTSDDISMIEVRNDDYTPDSCMIIDEMCDLGFKNEENEKGELIFYMYDLIEARYVEIIQEVCGVKKSLNYSISDSEDGDLFTNIYIYDSEDNDREYKLIYSFENDDYVIQK